MYISGHYPKPTREYKMWDKIKDFWADWSPAIWFCIFWLMIITSATIAIITIVNDVKEYVIETRDKVNEIENYYLDGVDYDNVDYCENDPYISNDVSLFEIKEEMSTLNMRYIDVALAQISLEIGLDGKGNVHPLVYEYNLFGMKCAHKRPTTWYTQRGNGYAVYNNWYNSILDYAFYQAKYCKDSFSEDQWIDFLEKNYAEDPHYGKKLRDQIKYLKKMKFI